MASFVASLPALLRRIIQVAVAAVLAWCATEYIPSLPTEWQSLITAVLTVVFGGVSPLDRYGAYRRQVESGGRQ